MEARKPHLSNSAIDMLSKCGEMYRRRYIEGEKVPPGVALIVGKGVDHSVNTNLQAKIDTGSLLPVDAVRQAAMDSTVREWDSGEIALDPDEAARGVKAAKGAAVDKAVRLSELHATKTAPGIEPSAVQRKWTIELDGFPFDITGFIDVQEDVRSVRDTKTSGKSPAKTEADNSDQLSLYALAVKVIDGAAPREVRLDYLVDNKTPVAVSLASTRTDDDFRMVMRRVEAAAEVIEKQAFMPARRSDWWCSERFCGYAATCPYYRQAKS